MANLLFVLDGYFPKVGGGEILFQNLCEALVERGNVVTVITWLSKGLKKFEIVNGVLIHRVRCFGSRSLFCLSSLPRIFRLSKKVDLIHTVNFVSAPASWFISKVRRKKCVLTSHEVLVGNWNNATDFGKVSCFIYSLIERLIYLLPFSHYITVSKSTKKNLLKRGIPSNKVSVVYNSVDYSHWNPEKYDGIKVRNDLGINDKFVTLFFGRPVTSKGLDYLIRAVPSLVSKIKNFVLVGLVSENFETLKYRDRSLKLVKDLGIENKVIFRKSVPYSFLPSFVKASDCVVIPSLAEGFGFSAAEACAMGVPVVASCVDSLPEVVSGKFVFSKPKDVKSIVDGVVDVFNGKFNVSDLKKFKKDRMVSDYLKVYDSLLGKGVVR